MRLPHYDLNLYNVLHIVIFHDNTRETFIANSNEVHGTVEQFLTEAGQGAPQLRGFPLPAAQGTAF